MGTTSEHITASFRTEATLTGGEAHLTGFLFQDKAPPKGTQGQTHLPAVLVFWASVAV